MKLARTLVPALLATTLAVPAIAHNHQSASDEPLAAYNIDLSQTSVSGISSGGFMTVQMHAAHAENIVGIGVFAGGPYECAGTGGQSSNVLDAMNTCMAGKASASDAIINLNDSAHKNEIAPVSAQHNDKIWLYSGYNDGVVKQPTMDALDTYYRELVAEGNVYYRDNQDAGHAQIVDNSHGQKCVLNGGEFINDCDLDGAGQILEFIYCDLKPKQAPENLSSTVVKFDQSFYFDNNPNAVMAKDAFLYVPKACAEGEACRLHIAFHGCLQNAESIGDSFYKYAGYNEWADSNNFVVLYPQTSQTEGALPVPGEPFNPQGCWDWWGFTDPEGVPANYATKSSVQIQAIWKMAARLAGASTQTNDAATEATSEALSLQAIDASDNAASLVWQGDTGVEYNITQADAPTGPFTPVNKSPITSSSYGVTGLEPNTTYYFKLSRVDNAAPESDAVAITTGNTAPECDPTYGTLSQHMMGGRAFASWGLVYATGSLDYLGTFFGANSTDATLLKKAALYYTKGNCPENTK